MGQTLRIMGGGVDIIAGAASGGGGGDVQVSTGVSGSSSSGDLTLSSGQGAMKSGNVVLNSGHSKGGISGSISISTGDATSGIGGNVDITVGTGNFGEGGSIKMVAGNTTSKYGGNGGDVRISTGSSEFGTSGSVTLSTADALGKSVGSNSGPVHIGSGSTTSGSSGDVDISTGSSSKAGNIFMQAGNSTSGEGPTISVSAGSAEKSKGGDLHLTAGNSLAKFPGGDVELSAGNSSIGQGGTVRVVGGLGGGDNSDSVGGDVIISGGNSVTEGAGGSVILSPGSSVSNLTGSVTVHSASGEERLLISNESVTITSGEHGGLYLKAQSSYPANTSSNANMIGLSVSNNPQNSTTGTYDLRLLDLGNDDTRFIASVPMQVTSVQYSSDRRIKERITGIDNDELFQRFRKVELKEYAYTEQWRKVRNIATDVRVRGVIANELKEIFPEHVETIPEFKLEDKDFVLKDFLQVNKNNLLFDFLAVFKSLTNRYSVMPHQPLRSGDVVISSADAGDYVTAANPGSGIGSSGGITMKTGTAAQRFSYFNTSDGMSSSGNLTLETGTASSGASSDSIYISSGSAVGGLSGDVELRAGPDARSTKGSTITLSSLNVSLAGGGGDGDQQSTGGGVNVVGGNSVMSAGGNITLAGGSTREEISEKGGSVDVSAGGGYLGGDIVMSPGPGIKKNGVFEVRASSGDRRIFSDNSNISINSGDDGGISLTTHGTNTTNNVIGLGMSSPTSDDDGYDFRLQSMGADNPTVLSTAPMQVTSVYYAADSRIKEEVVDVDVDDILQRIQRIDYEEYAYTDDWKKVQRKTADQRVRGVIAEQLAAVFPEHVNVIANYSLPDKGFDMSGFHEVDHAGLTLDLIGALQAHHNHFSVSSNEVSHSGNVVVSSAKHSSPTNARFSEYSASGNVTLKSGPAESAS